MFTKIMKKIHCQKLSKYAGYEIYFSHRNTIKHRYNQNYGGNIKNTYCSTTVTIR